jgi:hypothetical protein
MHFKNQNRTIFIYYIVVNGRSTEQTMTKRKSKKGQTNNQLQNSTYKAKDRAA